MDEDRFASLLDTIAYELGRIANSLEKIERNGLGPPTFHVETHERVGRSDLSPGGGR